MSAPATASIMNTVDRFPLTVLHYYRKAAITRAMVLDTKETALCGSFGNVSGPQEPGVTSRKTRNVVCPLCATIIATMKGSK